MSAKIFGLVWELALPREEKFVLLALADHADHDGNNVFPSVALVAWKTDYSERRVQELMRRLERQGLLVKVEERFGRGQTVKYRINLQAGTFREPLKKGAKISPIQRSLDLRKGEIPHAERVQPVAQKGELAIAPESEEPRAVIFPQKSPSIEIMRSLVRSGDKASFLEVIQLQLEQAGFETQREVFVQDRGDGCVGRIDLVAKRGEAIFAIECDSERPRQKSRTKLLAYPATKRLIILRDAAAGFTDAVLFDDLIRESLAASA
jgi:hypothetical protein